MGSLRSLVHNPMKRVFVVPTLMCTDWHKGFRDLLSGYVRDKFPGLDFKVTAREFGRARETSQSGEVRAIQRVWANWDMLSIYDNREIDMYCRWLLRRVCIWNEWDFSDFSITIKPVDLYKREVMTIKRVVSP